MEKNKYMKTMPRKREKANGPIKETYTYKNSPTNNKTDVKKQILENNPTKEGKRKQTYERDIYI